MGKVVVVVGGGGGVICRERRSVKRWLMKGKARQESSFLPLNLSSESNSSLLGQTKTRVEVAPSVRQDHMEE